MYANFLFFCFCYLLKASGHITVIIPVVREHSRKVVN